jgi:hypothetical protein
MDLILDGSKLHLIKGYYVGLCVLLHDVYCFIPTHSWRFMIYLNSTYSCCWFSSSGIIVCVICSLGFTLCTSKVVGIYYSYHG